MPIGTLIARGYDKREIFSTTAFNIDNGAGATIDDTLIVPSFDIVVVSARIEYTTETAGTVAGANAKIGTSVGGAEIVAATAYTNSATVGSTTAMVLTSPNYLVKAGTPIIVRHTGIATTAAGVARVVIEIEAAN